jgi:hypothetical protein
MYIAPHQVRTTVLECCSFELQIVLLWVRTDVSISYAQGLFWCLGDASKLLFPSVDQSFSAGTGANHLTVEMCIWLLGDWELWSTQALFLAACICSRLPFHLVSRLNSGCVGILLLEFVSSYCGSSLAYFYFLLFVLVAILPYIDSFST